MQFEENKPALQAGVVVGYALSYAVFTTMLFLILTFTEKIPVGWTYFHIMGITAAILLIGAGLARLLR